jgi:hypothetical protein
LAIIAGIVLLAWSADNCRRLYHHGKALEILEEEQARSQKNKELMEEYEKVKVVPPYPPELRDLLSDYQSDRAVDYLRHAVSGIDCFLITQAVFVEGIHYREVVEKIVLSPELSPSDPSVYCEVGHRIPIETGWPFSGARQAGCWLSLRKNSETYRMTAHGRVLGLGDLPEEFALRELRKLAAEIQESSEKP